MEYHNLEGIHRNILGIWADGNTDPAEMAACRSNLLKYCGLDTSAIAIVRVWEKLAIEVTEQRG